MSISTDDRQHFPATQRNRDAILAILQEILPPSGSVLEVASGSGEHALYFIPQLAPRYWIPSDPSPAARSSIAAWQTHQPTARLLPPIALDVCDARWSLEQDPTAVDFPAELRSLDLQQYPIEAIVAINLIHIAPWSATLGLMAGAERLLPKGGILYLYGAFCQNGQHTAPSNAEFDTSLRLRNPAWGVRHLEEVVAIAAAHQLSQVAVYPMPAHNLSIVFRKQENSALLNPGMK